MNGPDRLRELVSINRALVSTLDYEELLQLIVEKTCAFTKGEICLLLLADAGREAKIVASRGIDQAKVRQFKAPLDEHIGEALCDLIGTNSNNDLVCVPVVSHGDVSGMLAVYRREADEPEIDEHFMLSALADQSSIALEHATTYRKMREALRVREALTERVFAQSPVGTFVLDGNSVIKEVNDAGAKLLSQTRQDLIGHRVVEVLSKAAIERIAPEIERALAETEGVISELRIPANQRRGEAFWEGRYVSLPNDPEAQGDNKSKLVLVMLWDVTERVRSIQRARFLAEATTILTASLDYDTILRQLAELAVPQIADWCIVSVLMEDESVRHVSVVHRDPAKQALINSAQQVSSGAPRGIGGVMRTGEPVLYTQVTEEMLGPTADTDIDLAGQIGAKSAILAPLKARGKTLGVISMIYSESGRRYDETDLSFAQELGTRAGMAVDNARLFQESQRAIRMRDDVLAVVSHDLRNPLNSISIQAGLLLNSQDDGNAGSAVLKAGQTILRSVDHMNRLIRDLLNLASIQAGRLSLERSRQKVDALLADIMEMFAPLAGEKSIRIEVDCVPGLPDVDCDRERVLEVLANLVSNSVKFTEASGTITLRAERMEHSVQFAVTDTGAGISADQLEHIFDPYWKGKGNGGKGTGLGLYIAKGILEAHGTTISVRSQVCAGSTFSFSLPALAENVPDVAPDPT
jgi:PAS domain S-box-containing protein